MTHSYFLALVASAFAVATCNAIAYPVGLTNCGESNWIQAAPNRAVTMNQGATEVLLALNLSDHMAGTAYLDDEIWPELAESYAKVPVLSTEYPNVTTLMSVQPDFIFASYSSAFNQGESLDYASIVGNCTLNWVTEEEPEGKVYCRKELHEYGIQTYLQNPYCEKIEHRSQVDMNTLFTEIWDIANVFDVHNEARELIDSIESHLEQALEVAEFGKALSPSPIRVLWLDSWDDKTPFVGACCGSVGLILESSGAENAFKDSGREELSSWISASWEDIATEDPDLIVVVDAAWDKADAKLLQLCSHPIASELRAVKNRAFITVPFSASTLGVRIGALAYNLAEAMVALARNIPISQIDFSEVSITADGDVGGQGVAKSGVRVYTRLPFFNGTDLEGFCPGTSTVKIGTSPRPQSSTTREAMSKTTTSDKMPTFAIVLMSVLGAVVIFASIGVAVLVSRERSGKPFFTPTKTDGATMG